VAFRISPDGKFLAYTQDVNGRAGVWTKQISTNSNVQIVEPTSLDYFALRFGPDGQYVYYGVYESSGGVIYRVPTLGGTPLKIIADVDGQISFSPDGSQFVFERYGLNEAKSSLIIANADGTNERTIASRALRAASTAASEGLVITAPPSSRRTQPACG